MIKYRIELKIIYTGNQDTLRNKTKEMHKWIDQNCKYDSTTITAVLFQKGHMWTSGWELYFNSQEDLNLFKIVFSNDIETTSLNVWNGMSGA